MKNPPRGNPRQSRPPRPGRQHPHHPTPRPPSNSAQQRTAYDPTTLIMGRNCVREVFLLSPERIQEVWLASHGDGDSTHGKGNLAQDIERADIPVHQVGRGELADLVHSDSHQGIVARVSPRPAHGLTDLLESTKSASHSVVLALDGVLDPQNLGAILRAAECFGVQGVLWSRNRSAPLGPVVSKVSVGASEIVPLYPVANLHRALEECKKAGFWIVGAGVGDGSTSLDTFSFPEKSVLVMGAEGDGLARLTEATLDFKVQIPMRGRIDSLNVSQATAVFLSVCERQHRGGGQ